MHSTCRSRSPLPHGGVKIHVVLSDGVSVEVPAASVTLAYSNQLMEHLHPDDALVQLRNIVRALAPGGLYVRHPNRLTGPHDISMYFDRVATGFHLKEYTATESRSDGELRGLRAWSHTFTDRVAQSEFLCRWSSQSRL